MPFWCYMWSKIWLLYRSTWDHPRVWVGFSKLNHRFLFCVLWTVVCLIVFCCCLPWFRQLFFRLWVWISLRIFRISFLNNFENALSAANGNLAGRGKFTTYQQQNKSISCVFVPFRRNGVIQKCSINIFHKHFAI